MGKKNTEPKMQAVASTAIPEIAGTNASQGKDNGPSLVCNGTISEDKQINATRATHTKP
jgi:hypothetical protein